MARYFRKPGPLDIGDPDHGVDFDSTLKALYADPRIIEAWDAKTRKKVRAATLKKKVGEVIELEDRAWEQLLPVARHPKTLHPAVLDADADADDLHLGSIIDATSKPPEDEAERASMPAPSPADAPT